MVAEPDGEVICAGSGGPSGEHPAAGVPGTNVGYPAVSLGVIGLFFTAAGMRSILSSQPTRSQNLRQLGLVILLLAIFGTELAAGIVVLADPHRSTPVQMISYALVTSTIVGIARAWELVGDRDTGLFASIAVLAGHPHGTPAPEATATPKVGDPPTRGSDTHQAGERGE